MAFYCKNFNIVPSDLLYVPDDSSPSAKKIVALFGHIDRGKDPVDHHSMFLASMTPGSEGPHVHHCSFEIHDFDTQLLGHQWLSAKKYKNVWGVGRHILGSQVGHTRFLVSSLPYVRALCLYTDFLLCQTDF